MSEYQYYEFLAVDRPLDAGQLREVRALSTRADITATSFVNTYQWGNFHGDPRVLMERYYDAFLYLANWGSRELMIRLPSAVLDPDVVDRYCCTDSSAAWTSNGNVIVAVSREGDGDDGLEEDGYGQLGSIISVRSELARGDFRLLYLAWLHSVGSGELDDDVVEPPVPAGLASPSAGLRSFADFIGLDRDLLDAAAGGSSSRVPTAPSGTRLRKWVREQPVAEKDAWIVKLMGGDAVHLGTELMRRFQGGSATVSKATTGRTVAELLDAADGWREQRERVLAEEAKRQHVRREQAAAAARVRHLDGLSEEGENAWTRVTGLIDAKKAREYDSAVALLCDLRDLGDRDGSRDVFEKRLLGIRQRYTNRPALLERLDRAELKPDT